MTKTGGYTGSREHEPAEYDGEDLCLRCGVGFETGRYYKNCVSPGVTHEESCERYHYRADALCDPCEETYLDD